MNNAKYLLTCFIETIQIAFRPVCKHDYVNG